MTDQATPDWLYVGALCKAWDGERAVVVDCDVGCPARNWRVYYCDHDVLLWVDEHGRVENNSDPGGDLIGPWDGECANPRCCKLRELAEALSGYRGSGDIAGLVGAVEDIERFLNPPAPKPELPDRYWREGVIGYKRDGDKWFPILQEEGVIATLVPKWYFPEIYELPDNVTHIDRPEGI